MIDITSFSNAGVSEHWIVKISMNSLLQSPCCSLMRLKGQRQNVLFLFEKYFLLLTFNY